MSDVDVIIQVHTQGVQQIANLSSSLRNLHTTLRGISVPMSKLDTQSRAVYKALGITSRGVNDHAKSIRGLVQNQKVLSGESRRLAADLKNLKNTYALVGRENTELGRQVGQTTRELKAFSATFRGMRLRAIGSDFQNISLRLTKIGKDAQFVGRSLLINLTLPLATFARTGLQTFLAIDTQLIRLTKVLEGVAPTLEIAAQKMGAVDKATGKVVLNTQELTNRAQKMVSEFNKLESTLTSLSLKFGVSKDLVVSISADFAELGLTAADSITKLAELTLEIEKLGTMDIGPAQDLSQALYFQSRRALDATGAFTGLTSARQKEIATIKAATAQLYLFNAIENVTALTLRDLGDAFPEVASTAISFGLSMTEAAALLAPMKAAGLDVGASANSIKVSLQRLVAPTKQNVDMLQKLAKQFGVAEDKQNSFMLSTKTGLIGLEATVKLFDAVREGGKNNEAALRVMSELFEKRQGPRMYLAIEQLSAFNAELRKADSNFYSLNSTSVSAEVQLVRAAEAVTPGFKNFNSTIVPKTIRSFKDIGNIARIATAKAGVTKIEIEPGKQVTVSAADVANAKAMRQAVSDFVLKKKQAEGIDIISEVDTEAGRALMVQLAGATNAAEVAQNELKRSLESANTSIQVIKNAFKMFAADIVRDLIPTIQKLAKKVEEMYSVWSSPEFAETRDRIIKFITAFGGFLALLGPTILALGTFNSVVGNVGRGMSVLFPKLKNINGEFVGIGQTARIASDSINNLYRRFMDLASARASGPTGAAASARALVADAAGPGRQFISSTTDLGTATARGRTIQKALLSEKGIIDIEGGPSAADQEKFFSRYLRTRPTATRIPTSAAMGAAYGVPAEFYDGGVLRPELATRFDDYRALSVAERRKLSPTAGRRLGKRQLAAVQRFQESQDVFGRKGVGIAQTISDKGTVGPMRYAYRGQDITRNQARNIARGGLAGIGQRAALRAESVRDVAMAPVRSIRRSTANAADGIREFGNTFRSLQHTSMGTFGKLQVSTTAYFTKLKGGQAALDALILKHKVLGLSAPGAFKQMGATILGVVKNMKLATIAAKIFKMTLMMTGIGAIIAGVAAVVFLVIKNLDKIKGAKKGWDALKRAFDIIKNAAMEIVRPIQDLFAQFGKGTSEGEAAGNAIAKAFEGIARAIEFVAGIIAWVVENVIKKWLYAIGNIVMAVVSIFKGNWKDAGKFLVAAMSQAMSMWVTLIALAMKAVVFIITKIVQGIVWIFFKGIKLIVNYWMMVPTLIGKIAGALKNIPIVGGIFGQLERGINKVKGTINSGLDTAQKATTGFIGKMGSAVNGGIDSVANKIKNGLKKGANLGIKESTNEISKGKKKMGDAGKEAGKAYDEGIASALGGDAIDEATDKVAGKLKEGIMDAAQKLQDFVRDRFSGALKKFISDTTDALQKQKESALKVFDVQINTLMKLEKAEESLTRKKEYETNRRKLIDDATLRKEQYRRNRALAIYENRIDDARLMDVEEQVASRESDTAIASLDESRRKELAKENLDALREAINEAKELAGKFFDEQIKKFQEAADKITEIGPVTIEQYTAQLNDLKALSTKYADENNVEFGKMFEKFSTTIAEKMPNAVDDFGKALGAFTTPLDELVALAEAKYGLGSEDEATVLGVTHAMSKAVIGVTLGMLVDIGDTFATEAPNVIEKYGLVTGGVAGETGTFKTEVLGIFNTLLEETKTAFLTPYKTAFDEADPTAVFTEAIRLGNLQIQRDFENTLEYNKELFEKMRGELDATTLKWIALKAAIDAANDAASGGGGGGGGAGNTPNPLNSMDAETRRFLNMKANFAASNPQSILLRSASGGGTGLGYRPLTGKEGLTGLERYLAQTRDIPGYKDGGPIPLTGMPLAPYGLSGFLNAPTSQAIPAILHGGEFVINADAVKRIGLGALAKLNDPRIPKFKKGGLVGASAEERRQMAMKPQAKATLGFTADKIEKIVTPIKNAPKALSPKALGPKTLGITADRIDASISQKALPKTLGITADRIDAMIPKKNLSNPIDRILHLSERSNAKQYLQSISTQVNEIQSLKQDAVGRKVINSVVVAQKQEEKYIKQITDLRKDSIGRTAISKLLTQQEPKAPESGLPSTPLGDLMKGLGNTVMGTFRFAKGNITGNSELTERGASQLLGGLKDTLNPRNLLVGLLLEMPAEVLKGLGRTLSGKNLIWGENSVMKLSAKTVGALLGNNPMPTKEEFMFSGIGLLEDVMNVASVFTLGGTALAKPLATTSLKSMIKEGVAQQGEQFIVSMIRASGDDLLEASIARTLAQGARGEISTEYAKELATNQVLNYYKGTTAKGFLDNMYHISNPRIRQGALDIWAKVVGKETPRAAMPNMLTAAKTFRAFDPKAAAQQIITRAEFISAAKGGQAALNAASPAVSKVVDSLVPYAVDSLVPYALSKTGREIIGGTFARRGLPPAELPSFAGKRAFYPDIVKIEDVGLQNQIGLDAGPMRPDAVFDFSASPDPTKAGKTNYLELYNMQREGNPLTDLKAFLASKDPPSILEKQNEAIGNYVNRAYKLMNFRLAMVNNPSVSDYRISGYGISLPETTIDGVFYGRENVELESIFNNLIVQKRVDELNDSLISAINLRGINLPRQVPVWRGSTMPEDFLFDVSQLGAIMPRQFSSTSLKQGIGLLFSDVFSQYAGAAPKVIQEITLPAGLKVAILDALTGAPPGVGEAEVLLSPNTILRTLGYTTARNKDNSNILHILKQRAEVVGKAIQGPIEMGPIGSSEYNRLLENFYNSLFPTNKTLAIPSKTGMPTSGEFSGLVEITQAMRGIDLLKIIESGIIDSKMPGVGGYISNQEILARFGVDPELTGYQSYNKIREQMESIGGVLRGNSNYGYARYEDDFITAAQYASLHMNNIEAGAFYSQPAAAAWANLQLELDKLLGEVFVNLVPKPNMTYTLGDSYGIYKNYLGGAYKYIFDKRPGEVLQLPNYLAPYIPENINNIPLYGEMGLPGLGYTEVQFPPTPLTPEYIKSITMLRRGELWRDLTKRRVVDFDKLAQWEESIRTIPGMENYSLVNDPRFIDVRTINPENFLRYEKPSSMGWGSEYWNYMGPQESLVMMREMMLKLKQMGIKVETGVVSAPMPRGSRARLKKTSGYRSFYLDDVSLQDLTDDEFNRILIKYNQVIQKMKQNQQRRAAKAQVYEKFENEFSSYTAIPMPRIAKLPRPIPPSFFKMDANLTDLMGGSFVPPGFSPEDLSTPLGRMNAMLETGMGRINRPGNIKPIASTAYMAQIGEPIGGAVSPFKLGAPYLPEKLANPGVPFDPAHFDHILLDYPIEAKLPTSSQLANTDITLGHGTAMPDVYKHVISGIDMERINYYIVKRVAERQQDELTKELAARSEVLASRLYSLFGMGTVRPQMLSNLFDDNGNFISNAIVSRYIPHLVPYETALKNQKTEGLYDLARMKFQSGGLIDAWLGNYDVIGYSTDSANLAALLDPTGFIDKVIRTDVGGALGFSGTGKIKLPNLDDEATRLGLTTPSFGLYPQEFDQFFNTKVSYVPQARAYDLFHDTPINRLHSQALTLKTVATDKTIRDTVNAVFAGSPEDAENLIKILIARRDAIFAQVSSLKTSPVVYAPGPTTPFSILAKSLSEVSPGWAGFNDAVDPRYTAGRLTDEIYGALDQEKIIRFRQGPLLSDLTGLNQQIDKEIMNQYVANLNKQMNMRLLDIYAQQTGETVPLEAYVKILESLLKFSSHPGSAGTTGTAPLTEFVYQNAKKYLGMTPGALRSTGKLSLQSGNMGLIEQFLQSGLTDVPSAWLNALSTLPLARVELLDVLQDPDIAQYIDSILQGAGRAVDSFGSPMPFDLNVFRGVKMFAPAENPLRYLEEIYAPGKLLPPQYISSSINPELALGFANPTSGAIPVLENIKIKQGQKVWFPNAMGQGIQSEYEVTIPPTYQLRIKEIAERTNPLYGMEEGIDIPKPGGVVGPTFFEAIGELETAFDPALEARKAAVLQMRGMGGSGAAFNDIFGYPRIFRSPIDDGTSIPPSIVTEMQDKVKALKGEIIQSRVFPQSNTLIPPSTTRYLPPSYIEQLANSFYHHVASIKASQVNPLLTGDIGPLALREHEFIDKIMSSSDDSIDIEYFRNYILDSMRNKNILVDVPQANYYGDTLNAGYLNEILGNITNLPTTAGSVAGGAYGLTENEMMHLVTEYLTDENVKRLIHSVRRDTMTKATALPNQGRSRIYNFDTTSFGARAAIPDLDYAQNPATLVHLPDRLATLGGLINGEMADFAPLLGIFKELNQFSVANVMRLVEAGYDSGQNRQLLRLPFNTPESRPTLPFTETFNQIKRHESVYNALANIIGLAVRDNPQFFKNTGLLTPNLIPEALQSRELWSVVSAVMENADPHSTSNITGDLLAGLPLLGGGKGRSSRLEEILYNSILGAKVMDIHEFYGYPKVRSYTDSRGIELFFDTLKEKAAMIDSMGENLLPYESLSFSLPSMRKAEGSAIYFGSGLSLAEGPLKRFSVMYQQDNPISLLEAIASETFGFGLHQVGTFDDLKYIRDMATNYNTKGVLPDFIGPNPPKALIDLFEIFKITDEKLIREGLNPREFLGSSASIMDHLFPMMELYKSYLAANNVVASVSGSISSFAQRFAAGRGLPTFPLETNSIHINDAHFKPREYIQNRNDYATPSDVLFAKVSSYIMNELADIHNAPLSMLTTGKSERMPVKLFKGSSSFDEGAKFGFDDIDAMVDALNPYDIGLSGILKNHLQQSATGRSLMKYPAMVAGALGIGTLFKPDEASASIPDQHERNKYLYKIALDNLIAKIFEHESGNVLKPYNAHFGAKNMMMPNMTTMTIAEVIANSRGNAVGKYQHMPKYLEGRAALAGYSSNAIYSPAVQEDIMRATLLKSSDWSFGVEEYFKGLRSVDWAINRIARGWRSIPMSGGEYMGPPPNPVGFDKSRKDLQIKQLLQIAAQYYPGYKMGGYVPGSPSTAIPAILHGGEYVINAKAVQQLGMSYLSAMNAATGSRFRTPSSRIGGPNAPVTQSVSNITIQVENFIGEEQWFNTMMDQYNVKVLPKNQKAAGLESRKFTSYNGINQGL